MSEKEFELRMFSEHEIRNLVAEELKNLLSSGAPLEFLEILSLRTKVVQLEKQLAQHEQLMQFVKQEELFLFFRNKLQNLTTEQLQEVLNLVERLEVEQ